MTKQIPDDEFRKDFADSVIAEEIEFDTMPADLLALFEDNSHQRNISDDPTAFDDIRFSDL